MINLPIFREMSLSIYIFIFFIFVIFSCFTIYCRVYFKQVVRWKRSNIPFIPPTFLIGHKYFKSLSKHSQAVVIDQIYKENQDKDMIAFFIGTLPVILVRKPKLIHQLYVKSTSIFGTGFSQPESEVEAQHMVLLTDNKNTWKFGRNTMASMLSPLRMAGSNFEKIKKQIDKMWCYAKKSDSTINLNEMSKNFVIDCISLWTFGEDSNSYETKGIFFKMADRFFEKSLARMMSVYVCMMEFHYFQTFESLKLLSHKTCSEMAEFLQQKMEHRDQLNINEDDFVDFLRSLKNKNTLKEEYSKDYSSFDNHEGVNMRQMVGFSLLILMGASDTSSGIIMFTLHLLSLHPEHQNTIRREIREGMKKHEVSEFEFQVVQELQFTFQCLYETARLYPVLPAIIRRCSDEFQIPGTKYCLKEGDRIIVSPYSMHRDPKYFESPNKFDPNRFSPERQNLMSPETYLSFGIGSRKCPGFKQGLLLAATAVASLLHKYEIKPRSHLKQMDVTDFHSRGFLNVPARDIIVDIVPL